MDADVIVEERMISYEREFILQSCHYNSQETYDRYKQALEEVTGEDIRDKQKAFDLLMKVLKDIHGHNFKVKVVGTRELMVDDDCIVVWDEELDKLVNEWDRTNLSVHPDFKGFRATTEVMAVLLKEKLAKKWQDVHWVVVVEETRDIRAVAS